MKLFLPRLPLIIATAILNVLSLSPASEHQEVRVEVATTFLRSLMTRKTPIGKLQRFSLRDQGIKGSMWVATCALGVEKEFNKEDAKEGDIAKGVKIPNVRQALFKAIEVLGDGTETYTMPNVKDIEAEWTGYRSNVGTKERRLNLPEEEQYKKLMEDENRTSDVTILYLHGGAHVAMDPASHREPVANLCKYTRGRALSLRYRLAPQNPFPASLLDAFIAYLYLLSPPAGAFHEPVDAESIFLSGDSAGGGLATSLLLTLLTLRREGVTQVRYNGEIVDITPPAGAILCSPWVDISRSMPSVYRNAKYDYIPPPTKAQSMPPVPMDLPADEVWPTKPPRVEMFCNASAIVHPLVSPIAASRQMWEGHPPVWISTGSEGLQDEDLILAERLAATGSTVLEVFDGMPHVFAFMFPKIQWSEEWFKSSTEFVTTIVSDRAMQTSMRLWTKNKGPQQMDLEKMIVEFVGDDTEINRRLNAGKEWRVKAEDEMVKKWEAASDKDSVRFKVKNA